ncbi:hypothetical protein ACGFYQ_40635 [Streptomyces sp. NPDC048258]|uniref:hypothetical protein n=1 Tax=Streptomyces sp. NPDC048258 TaxID=3365527 RepID=UPI003724126C
MTTTVTLDVDGLLPRPVRLPERQAYHAHGYLNLHDMWTEEFRQALAAEARARFDVAEVPDTGPQTPVVESRMVRRPTLAATGPLLTHLHLALTGTVRAVSGRLVVPTFSAYGYYEANDETLLHLDSEQCDVTLLTTVLGSVGPLHLRAELRGRTMAELGALEDDPQWNRLGGTRITYPARGFTVLAGNTLPHHRPGRPVATLSAVAALCYRSLL